LSEGKEILDFLRANFARPNEQFDRIDPRLDELTIRIGLAAEIAPHPLPLPASGEREEPAKREGEGRQTQGGKAQRIPPRRSAPLARLERLLMAANPSDRIEPPGHALTKRRMRPVCGMFHKTVLHRVECGVVQQA
jgi:hypothetical protein